MPDPSPTSGPPALRFAKVPHVVMRDGRLSQGAKVLYGAIGEYQRQNDCAWPGQRLLAADEGCSERQVRRYLHELKEAGLLVVQQRGLNHTNRYFLLPL